MCVSNITPKWTDIKHWLIWSHIQLLSPQTTSTSLTWTLLMLAQHPDVQDKARQEVMSLLPGEEPLTAETVQQLTYLTCVIKETLRYGIWMQGKCWFNWRQVFFLLLLLNCSTFWCFDSFIWHCWICFVFKTLFLVHEVSFYFFVFWCIPQKLCHWVQEKKRKKTITHTSLSNWEFFPWVFKIVF